MSSAMVRAIACAVNCPEKRPHNTKQLDCTHQLTRLQCMQAQGVIALAHLGFAMLHNTNCTSSLQGPDQARGAHEFWCCSL